MSDTLSAARRSELMSRIRSSGTGPELAMARILKACGLRFSGQSKRLPGKPDFVIRGGAGIKPTALFVHGCFWHGCAEHCRIPKSRSKHWRDHISGNKRRDARSGVRLRRMGYRVAVVWEHDLAKKRPGPRLSAQ